MQKSEKMRVRISRKLLNIFLGLSLGRHKGHHVFFAQSTFTLGPVKHLTVLHKLSTRNVVVTTFLLGWKKSQVNGRVGTFLRSAESRVVVQIGGYEAWTALQEKNGFCWSTLTSTHENYS